MNFYYSAQMYEYSWLGTKGVREAYNAAQDVIPVIDEFDDWEVYKY